MKSAIIVASLCATLAVATPVKRYLVTEYDISTVTVYVTAGQPEPTSAGQFYADSQPAPAAPSETPAPAPAPSSLSWESWSSAPAPAPAPAPSSVPAPAPAPAPGPSSGGDTSGLSDYAAPIIEQHNVHRANHSAPGLQWDDDLASIAQQIAETCVYAHNTEMGGGGYGQNIGAGAPGTDVASMVTNEMYNGEVNYYPGYGGEPNMDDFEHWGHFSQIVWKDTTSVGCYTAQCGSLANVGSNVSPYFTVCNYKPAGNFGGQYGANVLAPIGDPTVTV